LSTFPIFILVKENRPKGSLLEMTFMYFVPIFSFLAPPHQSSNASATDGVQLFCMFRLDVIESSCVQSFALPNHPRTRTKRCLKFAPRAQNPRMLQTSTDLESRKYYISVNKLEPKVNANDGSILLWWLSKLCLSSHTTTQVFNQKSITLSEFINLLASFLPII
jgi:hypothetical protein